MRFVIAKPQNKMSNGDLFYTVPKDLVNCKEFEQIIASCRNRAKLELNNQIRKKLENEIKSIINTHNESEICIIKAITDYSRELGYPVTLFGEEAGTVIMYLIGASIPSKLITVVFLRNILSISLIITKQAIHLLLQSP